MVEPYATTNLGGTVTTVGVNGATVPGMQGVADFAVDATGTHILFTADGAGGARDLFYTTMSGAVPTTTRVVQAAAPSTTGVSLFGAHTFVTGTRAIFTLDDQVAGQSRLFAVDLTAGNTTFVPVVVPGAGTFPASGTGLTSFCHARSPRRRGRRRGDRVRDRSGHERGGHLALYSSLGPPTPTLLASGLDVGAPSRCRSSAVER